MEQKAWSEGDRIGAANIIRTCRKLSAYKPPMNAMQWSEKTRRMDGGRLYRFEFAPYQREMMETPFDPSVQMTAFQMASRLGKTEVCMNIIGHAIDEEPRRILVMYPTTGQAEKWSKETFTKELCENTPPLQYLVAGGTRQSNNTILHKVFKYGGLLNAFGGNAPGEMRRAKGNLLFADEIDSLQQSKTDEGDQLGVFWMRGSEFSDCIKIAASYPSVIGQSRIQRHLDESDFRKWFTPCPHCKESIVLLRDHVVWPEGRPEEAVIECPECAGEIDDDGRRKMMAKGRWKPTRPFKGTAGFWGNAMMSPHPAQKGFTSHLHWLAMQEINAERSENPDRARRVIANTIDAVPYEPEMIDAPDANLLYERREDYVPREMLPAGVLMLTAGVDVQKDRLEVSIWGWGDNREGWALEHRQVRGAYNDPKTWANLEQYLTEAEFQHPLAEDPLRVLGTRPKVFVDAGHWTDTVLGWTRPRSRLGIYASQGSPTINAPLVGRKRKNAVPACWVYPLGVNQGKENLYHRLSLSPPAEGEAFPPGYLHFPAAADLGYFDQLTAEIGKEETFRGEVYTRYVCQKGKRNEALDCAVYAMAAANARRFNYAATADNLAQKKSKPTTKSGTFSEERRHRQPLRSRSSWMNTGSGWKI